MPRILIYTVVSLLLLFGVIWLISDEPLSEDHRAWRDWHDRHQGQPGEAWVWLLGLRAPADENPADAGRQWLEQASLELAGSDDRLATLLVASPEPWQDRPLALPDSARLEQLLDCRAAEDCPDIELFLAEHAELLARFRDWPVGNGSLSVAAPDSRTLPQMQALVAGIQLDRLAQLVLLLKGESEPALALAEQADRQLRAMLTESPNLIALMIATRLLVDQTDWLLALHRDGLLELRPDSHLLAELEAVESALERSLRGEFGLVYRFNQMVRTDSLGRDLGWWDRFAFRWLYKPRMSTNRTAELYGWLVTLDQPTDLSALGRGHEPIRKTPWQPRNLFAYSRYNLLPEADPFLVYIGRVHDLSAKLALARAWLSEPVLDDPALRRMVRSNPYRRGYGIELDEHKARLCFDGPLEDRARVRCLGLRGRNEGLPGD
jgi:hypothetical protein